MIPFLVLSALAYAPGGAADPHAAAPASERYLAAPLAELEFLDQTPANLLNSATPWRLRWPVRVIAEGGAEAYLYRKTQPRVETAVAARIPSGAPDVFILELPGRAAAERARFRFPPGFETGRAEYLRAQRDHYRRLAAARLPGAAWFRMRAELAATELGDGPGDDPGGGRPLRDADESELARTMRLFSGARAIAENLQLDRALIGAHDGGATIPVDSIEGIDIRAVDWADLLTGEPVATDRLAEFLPADQYAVLFPSFQDLVEVAGEAARLGAPLLVLAEQAAVDAKTRARYERQLALPLDQLARALGPKLVRSVAVTGSDPYLRSGSDVAVMFESDEPEALLVAIALYHAAARQRDPTVRAVSGRTLGLEWHGVRSPDRRVHSLVCRHAGVVLVTNSEVQIAALAGIVAGERERLADLDEYRFFRQRYPAGRTGESAFLIATDAAIRRWCGPRWRIGASRRARALSLMAHERACDAAAAAGLDVAAVRREVPEGYGRLSFTTPIAELDVSQVTESEVAAYQRFRNTYQQNWDGVFDPIAASISVGPRALQVDLTVLPLIAGSELREWVDLSRGARLAPADGDPHAQSIFHFVFAIDPESETFRQTTGLLQMFGLDLANPLGWVGNHVALFVDDDPWLDEIQALDVDDIEERIEDDFDRIPLALRVGVRDPFRLAGFLAAARAFVEQSSPGLLRFEAREHEGRPYVRVTVNEPPRGGGAAEDRTRVSLCYAATPEALVITPSEPLLLRALERTTLPADERAGEQDAGVPTPGWLGESMAMRLDRRAIRLLAAFVGEDYEETRRERSFRNLPILDEWARLFAGEEPLAVHERFFEERLVCPGGGTYVWNPALRSVESTAYGCAAAPRMEPSSPPFWDACDSVETGLTFEHDGLRGRLRIVRTP